MPTENGRVCTICKEWKEAKYFYPQKNGKNGLYSQCKPCKSEYAKGKHESRTREQIKKDRDRKRAAYENRWTPTVEYPTFP